jgi:hypothetical protein
VPLKLSKIIIDFLGSSLNNESINAEIFFYLSFERNNTTEADGPFTRRTHMTKNIIPFARAQRSVKEVVEKFYQELDDIEEIVIIAKDRDGEWIFANSELENELEWIGSLYKFINKAILEDEEDF